MDRIQKIFRKCRDEKRKALVIFNLPFTFFKGMLDVALTFLGYKPLSPVLHGRR